MLVAVCSTGLGFALPNLAFFNTSVGEGNCAEAAVVAAAARVRIIKDFFTIDTPEKIGLHFVWPVQATRILKPEADANAALMPVCCSNLPGISQRQRYCFG